MDRLEQRKSLSSCNTRPSDPPASRGANLRVILWNDMPVLVDNGLGRVLPRITSSLEDALAWMLRLLQGGAVRLTELPSGAEYPRKQRESASYAHSLWVPLQRLRCLAGN